MPADIAPLGKLILAVFLVTAVWSLPETAAGRSGKNSLVVSAPPAKPLDTQQAAENAAQEKVPSSLQEMFAGADFDEIIFAIRQNGKDPHWYANFSY